MPDADLVRGLVAAQFPRWAGLPVAAVASDGTDNAIFRLGADLGVRLPRRPHAVGQLELERRWLPVLAPHLPVAVPEPVAAGVPALGHPFAWGVYRWIDGAVPADLDGLAEDLADFLLALHRIGTGGGPVGGRRQHDIGGRIAELAGEYDPARLAAVWRADRAAPGWRGPPVWVHGDLHPGNLLARDGRLAAVLDWSRLAVGDPALDLSVAWIGLGPAARARFRARLGPDEATWRRGRAWALALGVGDLAVHRTGNPFYAAMGRRTIDQVLGEA